MTIGDSDDMWDDTFLDPCPIKGCIGVLEKKLDEETQEDLGYRVCSKCGLVK